MKRQRSMWWNSMCRFLIMCRSRSTNMSCDIIMCQWNKWWWSRSHIHTRSKNTAKSMTLMAVMVDQAMSQAAMAMVMIIATIMILVPVAATATTSITTLHPRLLTQSTRLVLAATAHPVAILVPQWPIVDISDNRMTAAFTLLSQWAKVNMPPVAPHHHRVAPIWRLPQVTHTFMNQLSHTTWHMPIIPVENWAHQHPLAAIINSILQSIRHQMVNCTLVDKCMPTQDTWTRPVVLVLSVLTFPKQLDPQWHYHLVECPHRPYPPRTQPPPPRHRCLQHYHYWACQALPKVAAVAEAAAAEVEAPAAQPPPSPAAAQAQ